MIKIVTAIVQCRGFDAVHRCTRAGALLWLSARNLLGCPLWTEGAVVQSATDVSFVQMIVVLTRPSLDFVRRER